MPLHRGLRLGTALRLAVVVLLLVGASWRPAAAEAPLVTWRQASPPPVATCQAAAVAHENRIYVLGGLDRKKGSLADAQVFDPVQGDWRSLPPMPVPRSGHAVVVVDGQIHVLGGVTEQPDGTRRFVRAIHAFDPTRHAWRTAGEMPQGRAFFGLAVLGQRVLLAGGTTEREKVTASVETWDPLLAMWDRVKPLPQPRRSLGAAVVGGRVIVLGGEDLGGGTLETVVEYDPSGDRWRDLPRMPGPRQDFAVARLGTQLIVAGGFEWRDRRHSLLETTLAYDTSGMRWTAGGPLEPGRESPAAACSQGRVWLIGGWEDDRALRLLSEGAWMARHSQWRVDTDMKIHLAWLSEADRLLETGNSDPVRSLGFTPPWKPDIDNIMLRDILGLGFPLPTRPELLRYKLYLKFFDFPASLSAPLSLHRVWDGLMLLQSGNGSALERMAVEPGGVVVKKAVIEAAQGAFDGVHPFPGLRVLRAPTRLGSTTWAPQDFFDANVPFSSVYVKPLEPPHADLPPVERAPLSAQGVNRCREELLELLARTYSPAPAPAGTPAATAACWFLDDSATDLHIRTECPIRLVRVGNAMVFRNFTGLPMPQDPERLFLSGLLLVYSDDYRGDPSALDRADMPKLKHVRSHVLEIGSVLRI